MSAKRPRPPQHSRHRQENALDLRHLFLQLTTQETRKRLTGPRRSTQSGDRHVAVVECTGIRDKHNSTWRSLIATWSQLECISQRIEYSPPSKIVSCAT